ncbi:MAG: recombinase family protein [Moorellales bacterium]
MKAAGLYRVSTKKQVRGEDDSIAVQQQIVHDYAARHGLEIVQEYIEPGVSAYKLSCEERDILQDALRDALSGVYEVLLVFKADRLSRNAFEYPLVLWQFHQAGVQVIAVAENRRLVVDDQMEKLVRFIEGWQAETESKNISLRVSAAMLERAKQGHWSGGRPPYGFQLSKTKGGLPLEIHPYEASVLREMARLYMEEGMGFRLVAEEMNRRGYRTREGRLWSSSRVRCVLQNPIVAGLPAYNRTGPSRGPKRSRTRRPLDYDITNPEIVIPRDQEGKPRPIPEYQIFELDEWLAMTQTMRRRALGKCLDGRFLRTRHEPALLSGLLRCGYCGRPVFGTFAKDRPRRKDPPGYRKIRLYYKCATHHHIGKDFCPGPSSYRRETIDNLVMAELEGFFGSVDLGTLETYVQSRRETELIHIQRKIAALEKELAGARKKLERWMERLNQYFINPEASLYTEELMAGEIRKAQEETARLEDELRKAKQEFEEARVEREKLKTFVRLAPRWFELFKTAPAAVRKSMLARVIDEIVLWRDRIEIRYKVSLAELGRIAEEPNAQGNLSMKATISI